MASESLCASVACCASVVMALPNQSCKASRAVLLSVAVLRSCSDGFAKPELQSRLVAHTESEKNSAVGFADFKVSTIITTVW